MSTTSIIAVNLGDNSEILEELRNGYGSGPVIWNDMAMHHLSCKEHGYFSRIDEVWPLYKRQDIPLHQRAVLTMTYDNAIVKKENYAEAALHIRKYLEDFPPHENYVNHWPRIAEIFESNPDCSAIGFWLTSVCENPFVGEWNEDDDDYDKPDWDKFWSVYESLGQEA